MDSEKNLLLHTKYYTLQYSYTRLDDGLDQKQEYQPEPTISDREKP